MALGSLAWIVNLTVALAASNTPPMALSRAVQGDISRYVTLPGSLRAQQQVTIYAKIPGYLKSIAADKGDQVSAQAVLAELEAPELLAEVARSKTEIAVAEIEYQRVSKAMAQAPDLVMPKTVEDAKGRLDIAKANLERATILLPYTKLAAPFAGVVTMRYADPGAFIPAATATSNPQNAALLTLVDAAVIRAQVPVPELEAALVRTGQPVRVRLAGLPGRVWQATVSRQAFALDEASRTLLVEADLPNANLELHPGMYATVEIGVERHQGVTIIPTDALVKEKTTAYVFQYLEGKARKTTVKVGFQDGASVEVEGLKAGDGVLLLRGLTLNDGQAVTVTEAK